MNASERSYYELTNKPILNSHFLSKFEEIDVIYDRNWFSRTEEEEEENLFNFFNRNVLFSHLVEYIKHNSSHFPRRAKTIVYREAGCLKFI